MTVKIAYKVVGINEDGRMQSLIYTDLVDNPYVREYKAGETTFPHNKSKLFVFDSVPAALDFVSNCIMIGGTVEVWEVYAYGLAPIDRVLGLSYGPSALDLFWATYPEAFKDGWNSALSKSQSGTLVCDSLTLANRKYRITVFD